jgi:hypothetical protein
VRACRLETVRAEFARQYPADNAKDKSGTQRNAFKRAITAAQSANLVAIREVAGIQLIWLTQPEP